MKKLAPVHLFIFIDNSYTGNVLFTVRVPLVINDKGPSHIERKINSYEMCHHVGRSLLIVDRFKKKYYTEDNCNYWHAGSCHLHNLKEKSQIPHTCTMYQEVYFKLEAIVSRTEGK
jgi:hypothetical protein